MKLDDPFAKKGLKPWQKWGLTILMIVVVLVGLWLANVMNYINPKLHSPLPRYKVEVEEVVSDTLTTTNDTIVIEENIMTE